MAAPLYTVTNLVTNDQGAHPAQITDPGLKNAWGLSYSPTGPFWVSSNGTGTVDLYSVNPSTQLTNQVGLVVSIPGTGSVTGQVFNSGAAAAAFNGDVFLFTSEDGTVSGWRGGLGTSAETLVPASAANIYKGAALGTVAGSSYLYAANFRAGSIDVLKGSALAPALSGAFADPNLPAGYAPFNVQNLGGILYVSYAAQDASQQDEMAGAGLGIVNRFDLNGNLIGRVATAGSLNAPWGLAIAPSSFGDLAGALLVGNFGDGRISAFNPLDDSYLGQILDASNQPLSIDGLWALSPGNDGSAGSSQWLYFTAGPEGESDGLFGVLTAVPEPDTYGLMLLAFIALLGTMARRRRRKNKYPSPDEAIYDRRRPEQTPPDRPVDEPRDD
ncbi:TIGR03118 family protein [Rhodoferax sp. UBA5149]|uniref:TIGR03118 family protein n=1 Tax=Rhodoferax sp. UBA5149 TaxID=1947379 RepID=UPI0025EEBD65|nr:TIGR03118 family protein [Rhodoferax sp. UBA5149]